MDGWHDRIVCRCVCICCHDSVREPVLEDARVSIGVDSWTTHLRMTATTLILSPTTWLMRSRLVTTAMAQTSTNLPAAVLVTCLCRTTPHGVTSHDAFRFLRFVRQCSCRKGDVDVLGSLLLDAKSWRSCPVPLLGKSSTTEDITDICSDCFKGRDAGDLQY